MRAALPDTLNATVKAVGSFARGKIGQKALVIAALAVI
jgi:hypothetical protein